MGSVDVAPRWTWRAGAALALGWIAYGIWRLLFQARPIGGVDLRLRRMEVRDWFAGVPIYETNPDAVYPPASYLLLWPFTGWCDFEVARWLWLALCLGSLAWIVRELLGHAGHDGWRRPLVVAVLASYPVGATIGNGQLGLIVVACLVTLVRRASKAPRSLRDDLVLAGLFLVVLVKPSLGAFFFWLLLSTAGARPAGLAAGGYVLLTLAACAPQQGGVLALLRAWLANCARGSLYGARHGAGAIRFGAGEVEIVNVNLHSLFVVLRWIDLLLPGTIAVLALLGLWTWRRRRSSPWILAGVAALAALLSGYHGWYDHVVLVLPLIALHQLALAQPPAARRARILFTLLALSVLAPGGTYLLPSPWSDAYAIVQFVVWLVVLGFLVRAAARSERAPDLRT